MNMIECFILFIFLHFIILDAGQISDYDQPDHYYPTGLINNSFEISDSSLEVIGRWAWGSCWAVATRENYAFIGNGPTLHILDVSNPESPAIVGEYLTDGMINDIFVGDSLLYLVNGFSLQILSIYDPINPQNLGEVDISSGALKVVVEDSLAFVTTYGASVFVVDVSDPTDPVVMSGMAAGGEFPRCLAAKGPYAYVGNPEWPDITIVNATNPDNLDYSFLDVGGTGLSAFVQDNLLYVGVGGGGANFRIFNVSKPYSPIELGQIRITTSENHGVAIRSLTVQGNYAYAATRAAGIYSVDVSDPWNPFVVGHIEKNSASLKDGYAISSNNETIFAAYTSGLWVVDATQVDSLKDHTFFPTSQYTNKVALRGDLAFVASGWSGLWILDISNPEQPERIANINMHGWTADVVVSDSFAYVVNWGWATGDTTRGLWVIDISDVQNPYIVSHHIGIAKEQYYSSHPNSLALSGNLIFMTGANWAYSDSILEIIDVNNSLEPTQVSVFRAPYRPYHIAIKDSFAYLATPDSGLRIIDWSNPINPVAVSSILDIALGVAVYDSLAFVATSEMFIVNISNPYSPFLIGSTPTHYGANSFDIAVSKHFIYWVDRDFGVIDISDPTNPQEIALFSEASAMGVAVKNDTIVLADASGGIWIFRNNFVMSIENSDEEIIPSQFKLYQNFPNPFNPQTTIEFSSPLREKVLVEVINVLGQRIMILFNGVVESGRHSLLFDSSKIPSGIYFYRLQTSDISITKKMIILR
ncbi:MAG: T9SS type A sorting domain-containing protein [Fidelibacterota bacterium]